MLSEIELKKFKDKLKKKKFTTIYRKAEAQLNIYKWLEKFSKEELKNYLNVTQNFDILILRFIALDFIYAQFMGDENFRNSIFKEGI